MAEYQRYIKFIGKDYSNFDLKYQIGRNIDIVPFNEQSECGAGGIYFCSWDYAFQWVNNDKYWFAADIVIPKTAKVIHMIDKSKSNMIDILSIKPITEHLIWSYSNFAKKAIMCRPDLLLQMNPIPDIYLTRDIVEKLKDLLINRAELTLEHYQWIAVADPKLILKFPNKIKTNEFWQQIISERPDIILYSPFLTSKHERELFYKPRQSIEILTAIPNKTKAMNFIGTIYGMFDYTHLKESFDLINHYLYHNYDLMFNEMNDRMEKQIIDSIKSLSMSNVFINTIATLGIIGTIYGALIREVIIKVIEKTDNGDVNALITWADLPRDIVINLSLSFTVARRTKKSNVYDISKLVDIIYQLGGSIEVYNNSITQFVDVKETAPCTCRVIIPHNGYYQKFELNIMNYLQPNTILLNTSTFNFAQSKLEWIRNKNIVQMYRDKIIVPIIGNNLQDRFLSVDCKLLLHANDLFIKGYKVDKYSGLLYYLQILICNAYYSVYSHLTTVTWYGGNSGWINIPIETVIPNHFVIHFQKMGLLNTVQQKNICLTPIYMAENLDSSFVEACSLEASKWNEDFSAVEMHAKEFFLRMQNASIWD